MSYQISQARPDQGRQLAAMAARTFLSTYRQLAPDQVGMLQHYANHVLTEAYFTNKILQDPGLVWIAWRGQELVGYIEMAVEETPPEVPDGSMMLHRIYCVATERGKGLGAAMLAKAEAIVRERRAPGLWLGAWALNPNAAGFYQRLGYTQVGTIEWVYRGGGYHQVDEDWLFFKALPAQSPQAADSDGKSFSGQPSS